MILSLITVRPDPYIPEFLDPYNSPCLKIILEPVGGRQLKDSTKNCRWRRYVEIREEIMCRLPIDLGSIDIGSENSFDLGTEDQPVSHRSVVERFNSQVIADQIETFPRHIVESKGKHSIERFECSYSSFFVEMQNHFRIGQRSESMARRIE